MWELKYCQLCLLFQYSGSRVLGHQYFWFQFHSKFYLSDLSGCVPVVEAWFRFFDPCLGVCYDLFQCVVVPVSVCSRSVACVCVCAVRVCRRRWMVAFLQHLQGLPDIPGDLALARCNISKGPCHDNLVWLFFVSRSPVFAGVWSSAVTFAIILG